ncbi:MAG: hypothetical protein NWE93_00785 [Candidatus Bathyarchaeota archaeon]|nr:hypothetical protein [Candidatus Bathyarchaeota archaeon]
MNENKTNFIIAVRGYKNVKKEKTANCTDVTALDSLNNKVLLRAIEPIGSECIGVNDIKTMAEYIRQENFDSAILISRKFTDTAVVEMAKHKIQHVSDDYMPPFQIEELYHAIIGCINNQCLKKCGKDTGAESECGKLSAPCKIRSLTGSVKYNFKQGNVGLLKNDLKMALALNK